MSSFVQQFGFPAPDPEPEREQAVSLPEWLGPSDRELGVAVPLGGVVARSRHGAVALSHALVYSRGLRLHVVARGRGLRRADIQRLFHEQHPPEPGGSDLPDGFLRLGIELPDGRRVSNLERPRGRDLYETEHAPEAPVFFENGGGGGSGGHDSVLLRPAYWLWPLPPPGPIRVSCEWPLVGIPLSSVEIDGGRLAEAAAGVVTLWPDP